MPKDEKIGSRGWNERERARERERKRACVMERESERERGIKISRGREKMLDVELGSFRN